MQAAGTVGRIVRFGVGPFIVVIAPTVPDPIRQLRAAGAWLSLNPLVVGGCAGV